MNWRPWRREKAYTPLVAIKALGENDTLAQLLHLTSGQAATASSALNLYEASTAVSIPVNMIAEAFALLDPVIMEGQEMSLEDPVLDLLAKPSPHFTQELFLETIAKDYLITGESAVVALGNVSREPLELTPVSPRVLSAVREGGSDAPAVWEVSGNTLTGAYRATSVRREIRFYDTNLREFVLLRNYSTKDNALLRGMSPLVSASHEARQSILGTTHNVSLLEKGGRVSLVFHFEQDMSADVFRDTSELIRQQFGGADTAGEIGITAGGEMKVQNVGAFPKDMDYKGLQDVARKALALQYHVPLPLVSDERMTLGNYAEAKLALFDDAILPLAGRVFGMLSDFLMPRFGRDPRRERISFNPDTIPTLVERRLAELIKRKGINVESDNEIRAFLGREPYEGGDVILKPANLVPAGSDLFTEDNATNVVED